MMSRNQILGWNDPLKSQPERESSAAHVLTRAAEIQHRAVKLVDAAHEKLLAVTLPATPVATDNCKSIDEPRGPLFAELLLTLAAIELALLEIEDTLRRVDL